MGLSDSNPLEGKAVVNRTDNKDWRSMVTECSIRQWGKGFSLEYNGPAHRRATEGSESCGADCYVILSVKNIHLRLRTKRTRYSFFCLYPLKV